MEGLGIDLTWFLFQLGNFVVLLAGLTYLLHKPVTKLLETRRQEIADSLANAERIKMELASTRDQQEALLEQTRKESSKLLQETKERAQKMEEELAAKAQEKSEKALAQAKKDLENEREQLRSELKSELAGMVVQATQKVLSDTVSVKEKEQDIKKKIDSLTN